MPGVMAVTIARPKRRKKVRTYLHRPRGDRQTDVTSSGRTPAVVEYASFEVHEQQNTARGTSG